MKYSIEETTLTSLGDAVREKTGKLTRVETVIETIEGITKISKTPNATGFDSWEGTYGSETLVDVITIPNASSLRVKMAYQTPSSTYANVRIKEGVHDRISTGTKYGGTTLTTVELTFSNTDTITFYFFNAQKGNYLGYYAEIVGLDENGNLMSGTIEREIEVEVPNTLTPLEMVEEIKSIPPAPSEEAFVITGNCQFRFAANGWNWFIENYGDKITTKDITYISSMFDNSSKLTKVPFDINMKANHASHNNVFYSCSNLNKIGNIDFNTDGTATDANSFFYYCENLKEIGVLKNFKLYRMQSFFERCYRLRELPKIENADWTLLNGSTSARLGYIFRYCYSLRNIPEEWLKNLYGVNTSSSYMFFYNAFLSCYALDEINGIVPITGTLTSNCFTSTFESCSRVKNITFAVQDDGTPYTVNWKSQYIDLISKVGYFAGTNTTLITDFNSGITADKEVKDDATYQALKDDPDWWTQKQEYSRYNHDSAVATINSLPDTSAYLTANGGTNTIRFRGAAGSATDGGAINTLTEEEIAVATAKGWTVSLV